MSTRYSQWGFKDPRTLLLLYAADLAFRLRWEIRPALAEGHTVIAAPYLDTAFAFSRRQVLGYFPRQRRQIDQVGAHWSLRNVRQFEQVFDQLSHPLAARANASDVSSVRFAQLSRTIFLD